MGFQFHSPEWGMFVDMGVEEGEHSIGKDVTNIGICELTLEGFNTRERSLG